jgi:hypothetical protein
MGCGRIGSGGGRGKLDIQLLNIKNIIITFKSKSHTLMQF